MLIIGMLIALGLFFYMNNLRIRRMEDQHERSKERFERLLGSLKNKEEYVDPDMEKKEQSPGD
ncbi:MAG: hypothetical protein ABIT05_08595 [Chitinophagaceae bacterium]